MLLVNAVLKDAVIILTYCSYCINRNYVCSTNDDSSVAIHFCNVFNNTVNNNHAHLDSVK